MDINGPIRIGVLDHMETGGRELHITFTDEFKTLGLAEQGAEMQRYLGELGEEIARRDEADPNRTGMLIVQQLCEQFLPFIQAGEMALQDTIVVEIGQSPDISLIDMLAAQQ